MSETALQEAVQSATESVVAESTTGTEVVIEENNEPTELEKEFGNTPTEIEKVFVEREDRTVQEGRDYDFVGGRLQLKTKHMKEDYDKIVSELNEGRVDGGTLSTLIKHNPEKAEVIAKYIGAANASLLIGYSKQYSHDKEVLSEIASGSFFQEEEESQGIVALPSRTEILSVVRKYAKAEGIESAEIENSREIVLEFKDLIQKYGMSPEKAIKIAHAVSKSPQKAPPSTGGLQGSSAATAERTIGMNPIYERSIQFQKDSYEQRLSQLKKS